MCLSIPLFAVVIGSVCSTARAQVSSMPTVNYEQAAVVLKKYCIGCHNDQDREGKLSIASLSALRAGTPDGPVIVAGNAEKSKLIQVLSGKATPAMPPEDEPQPSLAELAVLKSWIEQGAVGEETSSNAVLHFVAPKLPSAAAKFHHVSAACGLSDGVQAIGRLGSVEARGDNGTKQVWKVDGLSGKVNTLRPSLDKRLLAVGCGIAGLGGEALILNSQNGVVVQRFLGHSDSIYCAALSPDGQILATGSYDRKVILWDVASGEILRELTGHNGAVFDLDFDVNGKMLATASADQTVKLWRVADGERLDTLGQPEGEQRCVRFSPDGQFVFAAGADKQIRKWQIVSQDAPSINPMLVARYAHESDVVQLEFIDSQQMLSSSTDRTVKIWNTDQIVGQGTVTNLSDLPVGLCVTAQRSGQYQVVQLDGKQLEFEIQIPPAKQARLELISQATDEPATKQPSALEREAIESYAESEPNDEINQALAVSVPARFSGVIGEPTGKGDGRDLVRFSALANETWIIEVTAARNGSPLDSRIEILDAEGNGVVRAHLQATRASYFTFRGKDSKTSDDFRLHKWEDMELDEFLYSNGEINRLWHYPRGPDSGFKVYPGSGDRHAFFDTTPLSHALGEPNYIVRPLAPGETPLPNGLPVFTVFYENDDDAATRLDKDSRMTFVAPHDADYLLRIGDARGFGGEDFAYEVTIRRPEPDFSLKMANTKITLPVNSGREWTVRAERIDGLEGPISIRLNGLPEGVLATNPVIIEAGQQAAAGCIFLTPAAVSTIAKSSDDKLKFDVSLTAVYDLDGRTLEKQLTEKLEVTLSEKAELQVNLLAADANELEELTIRPGQTVSARVSIVRNGEKNRVEFGKEDAGRNLPHGAFVDNIGLNGLLIPEDQFEREFFITAAPKVRPGRRQFHLQSTAPGKPTSRPVWLNVLPPLITP